MGFGLVRWMHLRGIWKSRGWFQQKSKLTSRQPDRLPAGLLLQGISNVSTLHQEVKAKTDRLTIKRLFKRQPLFYPRFYNRFLTNFHQGSSTLMIVILADRQFASGPCIAERFRWNLNFYKILDQKSKQEADQSNPNADGSHAEEVLAKLFVFQY